MAFDAFFLGAVLDEIREKAIGGRIEKIHQPSRDTLLLLLKCPGGREKLLLAAIVLCLLALESGGIQWLGLVALLPLALYSGKRGKASLKWLFYLYYPLHLVVIFAIGLLL